MADLLPTRALSLIQPWAWAVLQGPKDIENRTWWSDIRGPFWIAASAQVTRRYYQQAKELIESIAPELVVPHIDDLHYGSIQGRATITDCILPGGFRSHQPLVCRDARLHVATRGASWGLSHTPPLERHPLHANRWHFVNQYGYVLTDRTALAVPVGCKGHQRWWTVPADVLDKLRGAVAA